MPRRDAAAASTPLTHDPDAIHSPGAFSPDGRRFAFTHTERNGVDFDLALVGLDGDGRRELAQLGGVLQRRATGPSAGSSCGA